MQTLSHIHHVALATSDLQGTIRFWRDLLGLRLVAGMGRGGQRQYFFQVGGVNLIGFFSWPGLEKAPEKDPGRPVSGPFVFDHLAFAVRGIEDLWELYDRLGAAEVWVSEVIDHGYLQSIYTYDPNGICLEIGYPPGGHDFRAEPVLVDRDAPPAALEGTEPQPGHWPQPGHRTPASLRRVHPGDGLDMLGSGPSRWK
jgi:catechol 2,3-dioxygenase-like lactoylglutathione lyase family enzyme